jgi:lipopolysaccharide export system protein LptA
MKYFFSLIIIFSAINVHAQTDTSHVTTSTLIHLIHADKYMFQNRDSAGQFISWVGHANVQQGKTLFYADSIVFDQKNNVIEAFGNVHINDADSVHCYSQYLKYLGKEKIAYLKKNVKLTDGKGVLTTNELEYDTKTKLGTYINGGKVVNGKTVLTSREGYYYGETRDVLFKRKVVMNDPETQIYTDTLLYNINTDLTTFLAKTKIVNGKRIITTKEGTYDLKNKKASFGKRTFIEDSTYTVTSDIMSFDDKTGLTQLQGKVRYISKDSVGGYDLHAEDLKINQKTGSFLATQKPILFLKQKEDTIIITADTLYSAKVSELIKSREVPMVRDTLKGHKTIDLNKIDSSSDRFFEAYAHVKIFSDSMQAVGDSLFYSAQDSVFRLFKNPVAWAQDNQITGDTIYLYMQNKKPERLYVFENAMAISKENENYFNQVRGNVMNAYFVDGKINFIKTKGSPANQVYYAVDDNKKFIGVNQNSSDIINVYFKDGKAERIVWVNNLEGVMSPMKQVNHESIRVRKFVWLQDKRPKSKTEILETPNP